MALRDALGCISYLIALLQIALAVAIAIVVSEALWTYSGQWHWAPSYWDHTGTGNVCLMSTGGINLCAFTYFVIAVSLLASVILFFTQCFPRRTARCCAAIDLWLSAFAAIWWTAAAITGTVYGLRADGATPPVPRQAARTAVWAMGWVEVLLFILSSLVAALARYSIRRSELELSSTKYNAGRYERYNDTPYEERSSRWKEVRDSYLAGRGGGGSTKRQLGV